MYMIPINKRDLTKLLPYVSEAVLSCSFKLEALDRSESVTTV